MAIHPVLLPDIALTVQTEYEVQSAAANAFKTGCSGKHIWFLYGFRGAASCRQPSQRLLRW